MLMGWIVVMLDGRRFGLNSADVLKACLPATLSVRGKCQQPRGRFRNRPVYLLLHLPRSWLDEHGQLLSIGIGSLLPGPGKVPILNRGGGHVQWLDISNVHKIEGRGEVEAR